MLSGARRRHNAYGHTNGPRYNSLHNAQVYVSKTSEFTGVTMARIEVKSEITGTVWQIKSKPGDTVESGDTLVVIESMKMEIPVITEDGGVVKEILVKEKDAVAEGQVVAVLEG
jgi:acetyl-CoA carboxylase biotin carboxyl carrier protein